MNIFDFKTRVIDDYASFVSSFIQIQDERIRQHVEESIASGRLWPKALIQLSPSFEPGEPIEKLVAEGTLHPECRRIFSKKDRQTAVVETAPPLQLYRHQTEAIRIAADAHNFVLTTGTGSGKSLAYIIPIVSHVLKSPRRKSIKAVIVYPMNALANSQMGELEKFLCYGYPDGKGPVTFRRYTGQEKDEEREEIIADPPDILLTNYVMLELILSRSREKRLVEDGFGLKFLVLDELHTYRGRQGADVALLVRRAREFFRTENLQCIGTSATLASEGTAKEQMEEVAAVASRIFGSTVLPHHVITETLRRTTPEWDSADRGFVEKLARRIQHPPRPLPATVEAFIADPLAAWIETAFGLRRQEDQLVRADPRAIEGKDGAARDLSTLTGLPEAPCAEAIESMLLAAYRCEPSPETGNPPFSFKLHQFVSRGDTVFASLEPEVSRYLTMTGQQFVPGSREKKLFPLVFCRECGQEFCSGMLAKPKDGHKHSFMPLQHGRDSQEEEDEDRFVPGYLFFSTRNPWPDEADTAGIIDRIPDDWVETADNAVSVRKDRQKYLPRPLFLDPLGREAGEGLQCHFIRAPFRFCPTCGVSYGIRTRRDFPKLGTLGSEGRSSATTVISLSTILSLREPAGSDLSPEARKILSFTDNRQDASLQAGHFNDFVDVSLIRAALLRAAASAGPGGLTHEVLPLKVFEALDLPIDQYASNPDVKFLHRVNTDKALRDVLGYRIYRDLKRGWRLTSPNLEQCGLLEISYLSLDELCHDAETWDKCHPALKGSTPAERASVARVLLDHMRRELTIKIDFLAPEYQERIKLESRQYLVPPWAIDENERMEHAALLFPRSKRCEDYRGNVYLSALSGFGLYLRRLAALSGAEARLTVLDTGVIISDLLGALASAGIVEATDVRQRSRNGPVVETGYRLMAASLVWKAGDGTRPFHDPVRMPSLSAAPPRPNPYFVNHYRNVAMKTLGIEAREHTAQVPGPVRIERENRFKEGRLPVLYCSPTMELGIDIADLNVVHLRNIPPTPANYA
jgi:ATP-dependent helicase YprA (DUF1998 family)